MSGCHTEPRAKWYNSAGNEGGDRSCESLGGRFLLGAPAVDGVKLTVRPLSPLEIGSIAGAVVILIGAGLFAYLKLLRKKDPAELERLRRLSLGRTGRIVAGEVTGLIEPEGESTAFLLIYRYDVAGVTYEVSQDVSMMPAVASQAPHLVGKGISVKYDMKHPTNSIVICEEWSGIGGISAGGLEGESALAASAEATEQS